MNIQSMPGLLDAVLSRIAGMSRARFAAHFLATMEQTPFEYLALWRIGVAQSLLKKGEPLKIVAPSVGFASAGALIRSFSNLVGVPPMTWLASQRSGGVEWRQGFSPADTTVR